MILSRALRWKKLTQGATVLSSSLLPHESAMAFPKSRCALADKRNCELWLKFGTAFGCKLNL